MIRTLAGVAAGIAVAIAVMMVVEAIGYQILPPPRINLNNPSAPAALPVASSIVPLVGWFLAALAGGWLAIQLSGREWSSWLVAASVIAGQLLDYLLGRHTVWLMVVGVIAPIAAGWLAQKLPKRAFRSIE